MSDNKVAYRYAKSLFEVAKSAKNVEAVNQNMVDFQITCKQNIELKNVLKSPIVSSEQKSNLLSTVFASYEKVVIDFFSLVVSKNRAGSLPQIASKFEDLYNEYNQIVEVDVQSAQALTEGERKEVVSYLEKQTGAKEIKIAEQINPDLLGGLVIKYGDSLIDSSVSFQIKNLKKELQII